MVIIQAGHVNIENNIDAGLRKGTGAEGEAILTAEIAANVAQLLMDAGVTARAVDANFNGDPSVGQDCDTFVAVHAQHVPGDNFGVAVGNPDEDKAAKQSANLRDCMVKEYAKATNLSDKRSGWEDTIDESEYYMWRSLAGPTPAVLIECGDVEGDNSAYTQTHHAQVALGIANGVLAYLGKDAIANTDDPEQTIPSVETKLYPPPATVAVASAESTPIHLVLEEINTNIGQALSDLEQLRTPGVTDSLCDQIAAALHTVRKLTLGE